MFVLYAQIQDGRQNCWEIDCWQKLADYSADSLWVKNFVSILHRFRNKCVFAFYTQTQDGRFLQKFNMATKNGRKTIFSQTCQLTLWIPWKSKLSLKLLYLVPHLHFTQHFKMASKNGGKSIFERNCQTMQIPWGSKISSKSFFLGAFLDKCIFLFYAEIQDGHQKWWEINF